ncbi:hypothetical protein CPB83DRAFT_891562 [Crepidotus variabilis]|uniref:Uncharacterized protein n=1 Tax=Crepidotus variabilis TaxID=179855 RepID=A0A9P6EMS6_9AGAR|nr:hypothetical protein CPB83DRAFT_891562 [Crepidotus variabilis]
MNSEVEIVPDLDLTMDTTDEEKSPISSSSNPSQPMADLTLNTSAGTVGPRAESRRQVPVDCPDLFPSPQSVDLYTMPSRQTPMDLYDLPLCSQSPNLYDLPQRDGGHLYSLPSRSKPANLEDSSSGTHAPLQSQQAPTLPSASSSTSFVIEKRSNPALSVNPNYSSPLKLHSESLPQLYDLPPRTAPLLTAASVGMQLPGEPVEFTTPVTQYPEFPQLNDVFSLQNPVKLQSGRTVMARWIPPITPPITGHERMDDFDGPPGGYALNTFTVPTANEIQATLTFLEDQNPGSSYRERAQLHRGARASQLAMEHQTRAALVEARESIRRARRDLRAGEFRLEQFTKRYS